MITKIIEKCLNPEVSEEVKARVLLKINIKRDLEHSEEASSAEVTIKIETIRALQTSIITIKMHPDPTMAEEAEAEEEALETKGAIMISHRTMKIISSRNKSPNDISIRSQSRNKRNNQFKTYNPLNKTKMKIISILQSIRHKKLLILRKRRRKMLQVKLKVLEEANLKTRITLMTTKANPMKKVATEVVLEVVALEEAQASAEDKEDLILVAAMAEAMMIDLVVTLAEAMMIDLVAAMAEVTMIDLVVAMVEEMMIGLVAILAEDKEEDTSKNKIIMVVKMTTKDITRRKIKAMLIIMNIMNREKRSTMMKKELRLMMKMCLEISNLKNKTTLKEVILEVEADLIEVRLVEVSLAKLERLVEAKEAEDDR